MAKIATTIVSASTAYTASNGDIITKLYAHENAIVTLSSVEFGINKEPYDANQVTSRVVTASITAGSYFEGPIIQFKTSDSTGTGKPILVYLEKAK